MIKPVNGHLVIDPVKHESFMASQRETYEEVGVVVSFDPSWGPEFPHGIKPGDKVFFDSYLAAKYPNGDNDYYWLVKWEDVRAVEHAEEVPK